MLGHCVPQQLFILVIITSTAANTTTIATLTDAQRVIRRIFFLYSTTTYISVDDDGANRLFSSNDFTQPPLGSYIIYTFATRPYIYTYLPRHTSCLVGGAGYSAGGQNSFWMV